MTRGGSVSIFLGLLGAAIRGGMAYRGSFLINCAATFILATIELASVFIVFGHVAAVGGWSMWEVVLIGGIAMVPFGLAQTAAAGLDAVPVLVQSGELDRMLVRPVSPLVQVITAKLGLRNLALSAQGAAVTAVALWQVAPAWDVTTPVMLLLSVVGGFGVYLGLFIMSAATSMITIERVEAFNMFTYGGMTLSQYPVSIYQPWLRNLFLFLIPVGFTSYYPTLWILGHADPLGLPVGLAWAAPLAGLAFMVLALLAWRRGLRHYQSTGS